MLNRNSRGERFFQFGLKGFKLFGFTLLAIGFLAVVGWCCLPLVPLPQALFQPPRPELELLDLHDEPLRIVREPEAPFSRPATYSEIPQALIHATLAAEDKRFWLHPGVDWRASLRAARDLILERRIVSGGSTIAQQLIKLSQPRPRNFLTKAIEAVQALRLEQVWDKQRILSEYLNRIDYGNLNTGCASAVRFYFGKPLRDLSFAECAFLAGLPQAPARLNPLRHLDRAQKRKNWILGQMLANGLLSQEEFSQAQAESISCNSHHRNFLAPHFVDLLLQLNDDRPGRQIRTTVDLNLNRFVEESIRRHLNSLKEQNVENAAAVVIDNRSGGVWALIGSEDYFNSRAGQVNGAWSPRSAGSTFKPFTYAIALEQGATPASIVADIPTEFTTATGIFAPMNYSRRCSGPVRYREALANSLNIPAVRVLNSMGGAAVLQKKLQQCGLTTLTQPAVHYGLGLTIGNAEARLLELANAYACLARLGEFKPYALLPITGDRSGTQVFDSAVAYLISDILSDNDARSASFGAESKLRFDFPVACKTGTSSDFRDNWAFGYTPEFTVGVWVGNFSGEPMQGVSGVSGAAPIMHEIMEHLHAVFGTSWYNQPQDIVTCKVDPLTGKRIVQQSRAQFSEKFICGNLPPFESAQDYDSEGRVKLPPEYCAWFGSSDNSLRAQVALAASSSNFKILFPQPGTTFYLDPDLPDSGRNVRLRSEGNEMASWSSPTLKIVPGQGQAFALLEKGQHRILATDPTTGLQQETWIEVRER